MFATAGTSDPGLGRSAQVPDRQLAEIAARARWLVLETVERRKAGHVGGPLSAIDVLVSLYFDAMRIDPQSPRRPDRDRFVLSKGHAAIGLYAVLALRGYLPVGELATFDELDSRLQGHPDSTRLPGLDASTGSLGQGLAVGLGFALGARLAGRDCHTWVMLGDGELQEGMVWESVYVAARYRAANLTAIVDLNGLQQYGWSAGPGSRASRADPWQQMDLGAVFRGFGWRAVEIDGHDFDQIRAALRLGRSVHPDPRPTVVLAHTVKGSGVSFAENDHRWHTGVPDAAQLATAHADLAALRDIPA
jgi:transketolase